MITLQEIALHLHELLEVSQFEDYCVNGLQVEGRSHVKKIAIAVTASLEAIQGAVEQEADLLLVHHGLFWKGDSPVIQGSKKKKISLLLENDLSLLGYHLPLDAHQVLGNNWRAAEDLGWKDLEPFYYRNGRALGVRGNIQPTPVDKFKLQLEEYYEHPAYTAPGGPDEIRSVALISGGAHRMIADAAEAGVDAFVTGSFDEPVWHQAQEEGLHFFALGHSATEVIGPKVLGAHLVERYGVESVFLPTENPF